MEQLKTIFNTFITDILGFISHKESNTNDLTNEVMELVLQLRGNAKKSKDFDTADLIRDELDKVGIQIKDEYTHNKIYVISNPANHVYFINYWMFYRTSAEN